MQRHELPRRATFSLFSFVLSLFPILFASGGQDRMDGDQNLCHAKREILREREPAGGCKNFAQRGSRARRQRLSPSTYVQVQSAADGGRPAGSKWLVRGRAHTRRLIPAPRHQAQRLVEHLSVWYVAARLGWCLVAVWVYVQ